jgi:anti-sigma regulatory factor (Ser/Thr protein kinase)
VNAGSAWDDAPCGLLTLRLDGTVLEANRMFRDWVGLDDHAPLAGVRLQGLLTAGGRIYWETHLAPLLHVDGHVEEVALELRAPAGRFPVLLTAAVAGEGDVVRAAVTSARERVRYERELRAARTAAEQAHARVAALQAATAALSNALGVDGVVAALLDATVGPLGAAGATVWVPGAGGELEPRGSRGEGPVVLPPARAALQARGAMRDGDRVVVALHGQSGLRGVLTVLSSDAAAAVPMDLEVLGAVGQQAGLALDRARLYEHNAGVARELQHSLLAVDLPDDDRFRVAATYRPGVEMLEVGGDWYDVFLAEPGVLAFVVGDVVGRGLAAASAMGQLRSAVRAVAGPGVGPARLLERLDRFVEQVEAAGMATLAYAELDLASGMLRYACAGHPPPVLLPAAGGGRLLWEGRSTPLGAYLQEARGEAALQLAAGDRLLLYTDGLVERRDRALDDGLGALVAAGVRADDESLQATVAAVTRDLLRDEQGRDDVCVLLLAWTGPPFERELPADLSTLAQARAGLRAWLRTQGVDAGTADDVVLAASEAMANAAEHGCGPEAGGSLSIRAERGPDAAVVVSVRDPGRWRPAAPTGDRGHGLLVMRALMDEVQVQPGNGTTVVLRREIGRRAA